MNKAKAKARIIEHSWSSFERCSIKTKIECDKSLNMLEKSMKICFSKWKKRKKLNEHLESELKHQKTKKDRGQ